MSEEAGLVYLQPSIRTIRESTRHRNYSTYQSIRRRKYSMYQALHRTAYTMQMLHDHMYISYTNYTTM
jgi:hypothetical protein